MSISNVGRAAQFVALFAASWMVCCLGAEVMFRLLGDAPSRDLGGLYMSFAGDNYKMRPLVDTHASLYAGLESVYTDTLGLRCDRERRYGIHVGDRVDVLLLGDSQGFGNGVNFEDSLGGAVATALRRRGYRVANASVGGHSLASQYQLAQWLLVSQRVATRNLVLLLTPTIIASGGVINHATVGPDGRLYSTGAERPTLKGHLRLWAKTHLVLYSRLRDALRNLGLEPEQDTGVVFRMYESDNGRTARLFASQLARFQSLADENGASLQMVYVPSVVEADFGPVQHAAARRSVKVDAAAPWRTCSSVARSRNIPLYDLRPVLTKAVKDRTALTVKADFHYSPALSRECANAISQLLRLDGKAVEEKERATPSVAELSTRYDNQPR